MGEGRGGAGWVVGLTIRGVELRAPAAAGLVRPRHAGLRADVDSPGVPRPFIRGQSLRNQLLDVVKVVPVTGVTVGSVEEVHAAVDGSVDDANRRSSRWASTDVVRDALASCW